MISRTSDYCIKFDNIKNERVDTLLFVIDGGEVKGFEFYIIKFVEKYFDVLVWSVLKH